MREKRRDGDININNNNNNNNNNNRQFIKRHNAVRRLQRHQKDGPWKDYSLQDEALTSCKLISPIRQLQSSGTVIYVTN